MTNDAQRAMRRARYASNTDDLRVILYSPDGFMTVDYSDGAGPQYTLRTIVGGCVVDTQFVAPQQARRLIEGYIADTASKNIIAR